MHHSFYLIKLLFIDLGLSEVAHPSTVNLLYSTLFICYYNLYVTGIHVAFKGINK